jgi:hypothetical protein
MPGGHFSGWGPCSLSVGLRPFSGIRLEFAARFIAASSPIRTIPLHGPKEAHREQTGRAKIEPLLPPGYWTEWDADLLLLRGRDSGIVATFSARGVTQEAIEAVAWGKHGSEPTREEQLGRAAPWPRHPPG